MTTLATRTHPRVRDGRATREAILRAAARLMHLHGYHATSVYDVLRESAVGKGNFYYYFKSKEDLGYAIVDRLVGALLEGTVDPCFTGGGGLREIHCFLDRVLEAQRQRNCIGGCPLGNLASELSDVHEGFRCRLAAVFSAWRQRLTRALTDAQARAEVSADCRPETVAHFLVAALEGAILMTKVAKEITVMEQCVGELKRYLSLYETAPAGRPA